MKKQRIRSHFFGEKIIEVYTEYKRDDIIFPCFAFVRSILHPTTPGGLTHLLIPAGPDKLDWIWVTEVDQMEDHLLEHSRQHFRQAHRTPFTQPPLSDLLGFSGITPFGELIYQGNPLPDDIKLDPATRLLLTHQCSLLPPMKATLTPSNSSPSWTGSGNGLSVPPLHHPANIWGSTNPYWKTNHQKIHRKTSLHELTDRMSCDTFTGSYSLPYAIPTFTNVGALSGTCIWRRNRVIWELTSFAHYTYSKPTTICY